MVAVLAPVAGVALGAAIEDVKECGEDISIEVAAAPEIAPVLADHAKAWTATAAPVDGTCVAVEVTAVDSPSMATAYAEKFDSTVDVGNAEIEKVAVPDVWVPESLTWLARLGGDLDGALNSRFDSVAESPVGLAVNEKQSKDPQGMVLNETAVAAGDPHSDAASLALFLSDAANKSGGINVDSDGVKVVSAAGLAQYNAEHADEPLVFLEPQPAPPPFDYPYVTRSDLDTATSRASDAFRSSLLGTGFTDRLVGHGLQMPGPYPQMPDPKTVAGALDAYDS